MCSFQKLSQRTVCGRTSVLLLRRVHDTVPKGKGGGGGGCRKGNGLFAASEPRRDQEEGGGGGLRKLDCVLLQLFPNSCATDIVFVTPLRTAVEREIGGVH